MILVPSVSVDEDLTVGSRRCVLVSAVNVDED